MYWECLFPHFILLMVWPHVKGFPFFIRENDSCGSTADNDRLESYIKYFEEADLTYQEATRLAGNGCNIALLGSVFVVGVFTSVLQA